MSIIKSKNIYYFSYINAIGGIETFYYYLAKKYYNKDLIIVYRNGDANQIKRLSQYFECIQFNGQTFVCDKAFFNFNTDIINSVQAKEYILVLHGDYKAMVEQGQLSMQNLPLHNKINHYIGVSKIACQSFKELTGIEPELCYNPAMPDKPKRILNLISATRLSVEKGKQRIITLMNMLNQANIPYTWTIFTDDTNAIRDEHIIYKKPCLNVIDYINKADYLVQLSDNEGYCYSIIEALMCGTPVICTPCPVFEELGLVNGKNCWYCDFDMQNVPIDDIYNKELKFEYTPPADNWEKILAPGASQYQEKLKYKYTVQATNKYKNQNCTDIELNRVPEPGDTWKVSYQRYKLLIDNGYATLKFKTKKLDK